MSSLEDTISELLAAVHQDRISSRIDTTDRTSYDSTKESG